MRTYFFQITDSVSVIMDAESKDSAIYEFCLIFGESLYREVKFIKCINF